MNTTYLNQDDFEVIPAESSLGQKGVSESAIRDMLTFLDNAIDHGNAVEQTKGYDVSGSREYPANTYTIYRDI
ncbi:hypothetical protein [Acidithiobacillus sulfuriphilus]|uniref:hypothetical protein n=1 Tax=Acidithiobacillus sulfuriphilus TaxID=1867749 RepID=UPI003F5D922E